MLLNGTTTTKNTVLSNGFFSWFRQLWTLLTFVLIIYSWWAFSLKYSLCRFTEGVKEKEVLNHLIHPLERADLAVWQQETVPITH